MTAKDDSGPNLREYVETRFNLLTEALKQFERTAKDAQAATDLRYQQRFEAQSDALAAAFLSQQTAMQTAFQVAEKAVQAALAAADRAVSKAELAADKRFEALNELRQMLNDMVTTLFPRSEAVQRFDGIAEKIEQVAKRAEALENRFNSMTGSQEGGKERRTDARAMLTVGISIASVLIALIGMIVVLWKVGH